MCMGMQQLERTVLNKTRTAQVFHHREIVTMWQYFVATHLEKQNGHLFVKDPVNFSCVPFIDIRPHCLSLQIWVQPHWWMATVQGQGIPCSGALLLLQCPVLLGLVSASTESVCHVRAKQHKDFTKGCKSLLGKAPTTTRGRATWALRCSRNTWSSRSCSAP